MRLIAGTHYDVSTVDGGWRRGQIRSLTCRFCLFSVDVIAAKGPHLVFVEFKRASGGVQSQAQKKFEDAAVSAGVPYYLISDVQVLAQCLANLNRAAA